MASQEGFPNLKQVTKYNILMAVMKTCEMIIKTYHFSHGPSYKRVKFVVPVCDITTKVMESQYSTHGLEGS